MLSDIIKGLAEPVTGLISEFIEDKDKANEIAFKVSTLAANQAHAVALAQIEVNREEAKGGFFRAGWRPAVGWVCVAALANNYLVVPYAVAFGASLPALDLNSLMPILMGLLGLGGMRSWEKSKGVG